MQLLKTLVAQWEVKTPASVADCIKDAKLLIAQVTQMNWSDKTLESILWYKKHKGKRIIDVIDQDPDYINWCMENIEGFRLNEEAFNYLLSKEQGPAK